MWNTSFTCITVQKVQIYNEQCRSQKPHTRAYALNTELQTVFMDEFSKTPDVRVTRFNPILREIFNLADACEEKMETQNEETKRARTESIAQDNDCLNY
jgi:hypothetical protein